MHKFLVTYFLIVCATLNAASVPQLVVTLKDNQKIKFDISQKPVIEFLENEISIGNNYFSIEEVDKYEFIDTEAGNGVDQLGDEEIIFVKIDQNSMLLPISGFTKQIQVTDLKGVDFTSSTVKNGTHKTMIDLSGLNSGIYVISAGKTSFKINKK